MATIIGTCSSWQELHHEVQILRQGLTPHHITAVATRLVSLSNALATPTSGCRLEASPLPSTTTHTTATTQIQWLPLPPGTNSHPGSTPSNTAPSIPCDCPSCRPPSTSSSATAAAAPQSVNTTCIHTAQPPNTSESQPTPSTTGSNAHPNLVAHDLQQWRVLVQLVLLLVRERITQMDPRGIANLVWAIARLTALDSPGVGLRGEGSRVPVTVSALLQASHSLHLGSFSTQQLTNMLWAVASLDPHLHSSIIPEGWTVRMLSAVQLQMTKCSGQSLSNAVWASVRLGHHPNPAWFAAFTQQTHAVALSQGLCHQSLANILTSLTALPPATTAAIPAHWWADILSSSTPHISTFDPQSLANTVWACARLGITPPSDWTAAYSQASSRVMHSFTPQQLSSCVWACAKLQCGQKPRWVSRALDAAQPRLREYNDQALAMLSWALSRLGAKPSAEWQAAWHAASVDRLQLFSPQALSMCLHAHASWAVLNRKQDATLPSLEHKALSDVWLATLSTALQTHMVRLRGTRKRRTRKDQPSSVMSEPTPSIQAREVTSCLVSLVSCECTPPSDLLRRAGEHVASCAAEFTPDELSTSIMMLARLGYVPPAPVLASLLPHLDQIQPLLDKGQGEGGPALARTLFALSRWRVNASSTPLSATLSTLDLSTLDSVALATTAAQLSSAVHQLPGDDTLSQRLMAEFSLRREQLPDRDFSALLCSLIRMGATPTPEWAAGVGEQISLRAGGMQPASIIKSLWAMHKLGSLTPIPLLQALLTVRSLQPSTLPPALFCQLLHLLALRRMKPPPAWLDQVWLLPPTSSRYSPRDCAMLLNALSRLHIQPPSFSSVESQQLPWLSVFWHSSEQQLSSPDCNPEQVIHLLTAASRMQLTPPQSFLTAAVTHLHSSGPGLREVRLPLLLAMLLAVADFRGWLRNAELLGQIDTIMSIVCTLTLADLPAMTTSQVLDAMVALGQLRHLPEQQWATRAVQILESRRESMGPPELSQMLAALNAVRHRPTQKWLVVFMSQVRAQLANFTVSELSAITQDLMLMDKELGQMWVQRVVVMY